MTTKQPYEQLSEYLDRYGRGSSAELCRRGQGLTMVDISRWRHGKKPISLIAAMRLEIASNGELSAVHLCPEHAVLLRRFTLCDCRRKSTGSV